MRWITTWSYAQRGTYFTEWNQCAFSYVVNNNLYGSGMRLKFSNWYGSEACKVESVEVTVGTKCHQVTKDGKNEFYVSPENDIYSDIIDIDIEPCEMKITVSFGSNKRPESGNTFRPGVIMILQSVEVLRNQEAKVIALFGDSITHWGNWANPLIQRLYQEEPGQAAMFEVGINGSRLLNGSPKEQYHGLGYNALTRFRHDVLDLEGVTHCLFSLGLNDLSLPESAGDVRLTLDSYVECAGQIIAQAHSKGIRIAGLTICPRNYDEFYTEEKNELRRRINDWIMNKGAFDACVDVAAVVKNDADNALQPCYDCGDGVHISTMAGERIAAVIAESLCGR